MNREYIEFLQELFPSISEDTAKQVKSALDDYYSLGDEARFVTHEIDEEFLQGDIFSNVPFVYIDEEGKGRLFVTDGMLITNSCDSVRKDYLQFAAVSHLADYSSDKQQQESIKDNQIYQYMYIPDLEFLDSFVNFGLISSIKREAFVKFVSARKSYRKASLNQYGYFLFLTKLTVFFMRREDKEILSAR